MDRVQRSPETGDVERGSVPGIMLVFGAGLGSGFGNGPFPEEWHFIPINVSGVEMSEGTCDRFKG